jgi:dTDP-4-dehydrorhamnose reductase
MSILKNILITGGGGMLARAIGDAVVALGHTPTLLGRADLDVTDPLDVVAKVDRIAPTVIINCAAYTKVDLAEQQREQAEAVNGKAVGILAEVCKRHAIPLVHFSTDYVFDGTLRRPLKPDDKVGPRSVYGMSKLLGERMLQESPPNRWLILRTAWLYGPGGPNFVQTMLNAARAGKPLSVINDQHGSPTYTRDLAEATLHLLQTNSAGVYHLSNAGQTTWFDFTTKIMDEYSITPASLTPITTEQWRAIKPASANRPAYSVLDTSAYTARTRRQMPDWADGLRRFRVEQQSAVAS